MSERDIIVIHKDLNEPTEQQHSHNNQRACERVSVWMHVWVCSSNKIKHVNTHSLTLALCTFCMHFARSLTWIAIYLYMNSCGTFAFDRSYNCVFVSSLSIYLHALWISCDVERGIFLRYAIDVKVLFWCCFVWLVFEHLNTLESYYISLFTFVYFVCLEYASCISQKCWSISNEHLVCSAMQEPNQNQQRKQFNSNN